MYQIKTKYRDQHYYWYGVHKYWKLTEYASKVFETLEDAQQDLDFISELGGTMSTNATIIEASSYNEREHLKLIKGGSK